VNKLNLSSPVFCGESAPQTRRRFIRSVIVGTAFSTVIRKVWLDTLVAECQPVQPGDGILRVKISDFPALMNENGSVRLAFNPFSISGPAGPFYPVLLNRGANNQFFSLSTKCQHMFCVVPTYNATVGASTCLCHGSQYGLDGRVLRGPTTKPLISYSNSFDGATLCVEIPGLGFSVTRAMLQSASNPRFQLTFPTKSGLEYQVVFQRSLTDAGTVVPFAAASSGMANATILKGDGSDATVFVDRTSDGGFYSVAVVVTQG
jgi:hypothetical protein